MNQVDEIKLLLERYRAILSYLDRLNQIYINNDKYDYKNGATWTDFDLVREWRKSKLFLFKVVGGNTQSIIEELGKREGANQFINDMEEATRATILRSIELITSYFDGKTMKNLRDAKERGNEEFDLISRLRRHVEIIENTVFDKVVPVIIKLLFPATLKLPTKTNMSWWRHGIKILPRFLKR